MYTKAEPVVVKKQPLTKQYAYIHGIQHYGICSFGLHFSRKWMGKRPGNDRDNEGENATRKDE